MKSGNKYQSYIKGEMTEDAMDDFTAQIVGNYFEEKMLKDKWSKIVSEKYDLSHLKSDPSKFTKKKNRERLLYAVMSIAASLLFAFVVFKSLSSNSAMSKEQLVEHYLEKPFPYAATRKGPQDISVLRLAAGDAYGEQNYRAAIKAFSAIILLPDVNSSDYFYLGLSHLYSKEAEKAILYIEKSRAIKSTLFNKESKWYLALAHLQNADFAKAKPYLEEIAQWKLIPNARTWDVTKAAEAEALLKAFE